VKIIHSLNEASFQHTCLTIGVFDGVHRGHQEILRKLIGDAHEQNELAVVLTFDPHPAIVLGGKTDFKCLTIVPERLEYLESLGLDAVIVQTFSREFADQSAQEFMDRVKRSVDLRTLFIGYDTALGRGREGNAARLIEIGKQLGFAVQMIPPLRDEKGIISSTRIRQTIVAGKVSEAAGDLGREYSVSGTVIHGDGRGHLIQVPTANIEFPPSKVLPANGIYAGWVWVDGQKYQAATNVGVRPTFKPDLPAPTIEAHLLDFDHNLYGKQVKLEFVEYLRPERKYDSVDALVAQIRADVDRTRAVLARSGSLIGSG
jgi:riboflavin kinase / FMN adenylyltransferase